MLKFMTLYILLLSITIIKSDLSSFLSEIKSIGNKAEGIYDVIGNKAGQIYDVIGNKAEQIFDSVGNIPEACKNELISLKSVINVIISSHGTDEIIFYATKDLVDHFPGLNQNCKIPLPTINTKNWKIEEFKKYKCALEVVTFATTATACIEAGVVVSCGKAIASLISIGRCIKDIIN